jgi:hypothetical protein
MFDKFTHTHTGNLQSTIRILDTLADVAPSDWDRLAGSSPFLRHAFLHGLQATGCTTAQTGWSPCHLTLWRGDTLTGAMPLYLKDHSYGEYVFDWAWAEAYHRHGLDYYPKLFGARSHRVASAAESERDRAPSASRADAGRRQQVVVAHPLPADQVANRARAALPPQRATDQPLSRSRNPATLNRQRRKKIRVGAETRRRHLCWFSGTDSNRGGLGLRSLLPQDYHGITDADRPIFHIAGHMPKTSC